MLSRQCDVGGQSDFIGGVSGLQSAAATIHTLLKELSAQKTEIGQKLSDPVLEQFSRDFSELRKEVLTLKVPIAAMSRTVTACQTYPPLLSAPAIQPSQPITSIQSQKQPLAPPSAAREPSQRIISTASQNQPLSISLAARQPIPSHPSILRESTDYSNVSPHVHSFPC
jgi:hypothetical protein